MRHRVNSLVSVVFASSLAAAMLPTANSPVSAADECIGKPDLDVKQAGHWYYRTDRLRHRRCWLFETSQVPDSASSSADQVPAAKEDSPSWFSYFATGLAQVFSPQPNQTSVLAFSAEQKQSNNMSAFSSEPQQNSISSFSSEPQQRGFSDKSSTVTNTASLRHPRANKIARRERSRVDSPTTSGLASVARHDQVPVQGTPEKDDKLSRQLTATERQALFEEFMKWYKDTSVFGQP